MRRVVVLRPKPGASETVKRARELGLEPVSVPLFEVEAVEWTMPDGAFDGVLLTSANAVRQAGEQLQKLRALPAYTVGEATAEAARDAGFDVAATGDDGVERLLGSIDPGLRLIHLCGEDRKSAPDARQEIEPVAVYRSKAIQAPTLGDVNGSVALVHSPRAGSRLGELVKDKASIAVVAISKAAANAVGEGWEVVTAADKPTDDAVLALAAELCNKPQP
jgi:uroporphyrinogen-III synthase